LLDLIPPQAFNRPEGTAERFTGKAGPVFDPVSAAVTAADLAVSGLLNPQRAARLATSHDRDPKAPSFGEVVEALVTRTWKAHGSEGPTGPIAEAVQWLVVTRLIDLASDEGADPHVRGVASCALANLVHEIDLGNPARLGNTHAWAAAMEIRRFLNRPDATHRRAEPPPSPPGDPIGGGQ
jgi:hypothetical protein